MSNEAKPPATVHALVPDSYGDRKARWAPIGELLVRSGKLKPKDVERILQYQRKRPLRFGELAKRLGLLRMQEIDAVLSDQFGGRRLRPRHEGLGRELVVALDPFGPRAGEIHAIRNRLTAASFADENPALAIASAEERDGRSYLAANLATSFAQRGMRTLLIDANLRAPRQHRIFNIKNTYGLAPLLATGAGISRLRGTVLLGGLAVLPAGPTPRGPLPLLGSPEFPELLDRARRHFDLVLLDTPCGRHADIDVIASCATDALIVVRKNNTKAHGLSALMGRLRDLGINPLGSVLNRH
jgi:protein-tyrosine kinase